MKCFSYPEIFCKHNNCNAIDLETIFNQRFHIAFNFQLKNFNLHTANLPEGKNNAHAMQQNSCKLSVLSALRATKTFRKLNFVLDLYTRQGQGIRKFKGGIIGLHTRQTCYEFCVCFRFTREANQS